jgi:hypothetical protein
MFFYFVNNSRINTRTFIKLTENQDTHIAHGSPTDVRQMSYWDIQNIRWMSEGPPHIRTGGRSEVGITLEDLPKSAPTDIRRSSIGT